MSSEERKRLTAVNKTKMHQPEACRVSSKTKTKTEKREIDPFWRKESSVSIISAGGCASGVDLGMTSSRCSAMQ